MSGFVTLDDLATPVMICSQDGIVTYKNKMALRELRLPRRNTRVQPRILPDCRKEFAKITEKGVGLVAIDTGDRQARAFVSPYVRFCEPCTLWVFLSLIQIPSTNKYTRDIENDITALAGQICQIVKNIDESSLSSKGTPGDTFGPRMLEKIKKVISYVFYSGNEAFFPINKLIPMLADITEKTFAKFGYDVRYGVAGAVSNSMRMIDAGSFSLLFFHLMAFFVECGADRSINVTVALSNEERMGIKISLTVPEPPFYGEGSGDIMTLSRFSPEKIVDILVFERMCEVNNYAFAYSVNEDKEENVNIFIDVPVAERRRVRETFPLDGNDELEEGLLRANLAGLFLYMLDYRKFKNGRPFTENGA